MIFHIVSSSNYYYVGIWINEACHFFSYTLLSFCLYVTFLVCFLFFLWDFINHIFQSYFALLISNCKSVSSYLYIITPPHTYTPCIQSSYLLHECSIFLYFSRMCLFPFCSFILLFFFFLTDLIFKVRNLFKNFTFHLSQEIAY